jgi:hypothetical protein
MSKSMQGESGEHEVGDLCKDEKNRIGGEGK